MNDRPPTPERAVNPDQALIHRFLREDPRPLPMDSNPLARALRTELHAADGARGHVVLEFEPDALFLQGGGVVQGGAISAMLDFAMAYAVLAHLPAGTSCTTVDLHTQFLRPAARGRYRAFGELERCGKALAFARARLVRAGHEAHTIATATSTLALL